MSIVILLEEMKRFFPLIYIHDVDRAEARLLSGK